MTAADLLPRLAAVGANLARTAPALVVTLIAFLEAIARALDVVRSDRYEIQRPIGGGGQAEVFLGTLHGSEGFERPVAVKRARSEPMLLEEALLTAGLAHPNLISAVDLMRDQTDRLLFVMEHVDGCDLARLIAAGPVPPPVAIFIVREVLAGLGYVHARALVHRDVTPGNVLLSREGAVKLADFGVARCMGPVAVSIPPVGTPGYLSPEQMSGEDLDGRSDLYAVGIILWELLALRPLRAEGEEGSSPVRDIPRPSDLRPEVPRDLEDVAMQLLAFRREVRYQTAEEAIEDLALCQDAPLVGRDELTELIAQRFPPPPPPPPPPRRRRR